MSADDIDVFISYSHAADGELSPGLQRALERLARPWYRPRALRVFRDQTDLAAADDLGREIRNALDRSRYFLLLASPRAAKSPWVGEEIEFWQQHRERSTFLIAVTDGIVQWDKESGDFDWDATTAAGPAPERTGHVGIFAWNRRREFAGDFRSGRWPSYATFARRQPQVLDSWTEAESSFDCWRRRRDKSGARGDVFECSNRRLS
ncbi:TIR domain-containing protein [Nocardia sp. NPDC006044]|uniref:TIR domain-containing protein n=1 Tax=Nocardia sp. NPDC006044 TaxID=3364306 RepID=UPI003686C23A